MFQIKPSRCGRGRWREERWGEERMNKVLCSAPGCTEPLCLGFFRPWHTGAACEEWVGSRKWLCKVICRCSTELLFKRTPRTSSAQQHIRRPGHAPIRSIGGRMARMKIENGGGGVQCNRVTMHSMWNCDTSCVSIHWCEAHQP